MIEWADRVAADVGLAGYSLAKRINAHSTVRVVHGFPSPDTTCGNIKARLLMMTARASDMKVRKLSAL